MEKQDMEEPGCENGNEPGSGSLDRKCDRKCFILLPFSFTGLKLFFFFFFFFKCNRTIGSRSIGHRVWSMSLKLSEN